MSSSGERIILQRQSDAACACIDPSAVPQGAFGGACAAPVEHVPACAGAALRGRVVVDPKNMDNGKQHTQYPYVTGTSVMALKFKDGIMMACDTLGAYGSTKRYKSVDRIRNVGSLCVLGGGGELSDYHAIITMLEEVATNDFCYDDGVSMDPKEIHEYLCRVMYGRRNKFDPLWNSLVVGGVSIDRETNKCVPYLGSVSMIGTHYSDSHIATGFGQHLARPLFRAEQHDDMTMEEAEALLKKALKVCYYRDKNSINKFMMKVVTADGIKSKGPFSVETEWNLKAFVNPTQDSVGGW